MPLGAIGVSLLVHQAAVEITRRHGFSGLSVARVAERAGVTRRTFFHHFACEADAVLALKMPVVPGGVRDAFRSESDDLLMRVARLVSGVAHTTSLSDMCTQTRLEMIATYPVLRYHYRCRLLAAEELAEEVVMAETQLDEETVQTLVALSGAAQQITARNPTAGGIDTAIGLLRSQIARRTQT